MKKKTPISDKKKAAFIAWKRCRALLEFAIHNPGVLTSGDQKDKMKVDIVAQLAQDEAANFIKYKETPRGEEPG